jgi:hypothetical protein
MPESFQVLRQAGASRVIGREIIFVACDNKTALSCFGIGQRGKQLRRFRNDGPMRAGQIPHAKDTITEEKSDQRRNDECQRHGREKKSDVPKRFSERGLNGTLVVLSWVHVELRIRSW